MAYQQQNMGSGDFNKSRDDNPDPITGAPGSHPIGTGIGAAVGGGVVGGALAGSAAGPVGTAIGAVVGAVAGGLAGKGVAEGFDPTAEDKYWRDNYKTRPYYQSGYDYDEYAPAYRYGWESRQRYAGKKFSDVESDLSSGWEKFKGKSRLAWDRAKDATRGAWDHVEHGFHRAGDKMAAATDTRSDFGRSSGDFDRSNPDVSMPKDAMGREVRRTTENMSDR